MGSKLQGLSKLLIGSLLLAILIICSLIFSKEAKARSSDFIIENGTLQGYKGSDEIVTVPDNVTIIGSNAFQSNQVITEVILPEGLKRIENCAFRSCTELRSIQIPDSVEFFGSQIFYNCSSLENVILPNGIKYLDNTFEKCISLTEIKIPESVETICNWAFRDCTSLKTIEIPKSVNHITANSFVNCAWLNNNHDEYVAVNNILIKYQGEASDIVIPDGITAIGDQVFYHNTKLTSVTFPNSLKRIEFGAFWGCTGLTEIHIPDSVTYMDSRVFEDCSNLETVTVSKNCTEFGSNVFKGTKFYTDYKDDFFQFNGILLSYKGTSPNLRIPDYISKVYFRAIAENDTISSLSFPRTITNLYYYDIAYKCPNLKRIYIPDTVEYITEKAFTECSPELTIFGSVNSYAESYAKKYGLPFVELSINKKEVKLYNGNPLGTVNLSIIGMKDGITWSSDNTKVASVSETGKVTAIGAGKSVISAEINGLFITCDITVKEPYLSYKVLKLKKGNTFTLKMYGYSSDITWKSSNSSIVKVTSNGKVTAVKAGKAVITATVNGKKYQCTITVH